MWVKQDCVLEHFIRLTVKTTFVQDASVPQQLIIWHQSDGSLTSRERETLGLDPPQ